MSNKLLKLPVAKVGSWFHEHYGVVSFQPADLDALERNYRNMARGYEPYTRYGHNQKGPGIMDGERAVAHMVDVAREGDVLFGLFKPNNDEVVGEVDRGEYRYASPEIIRKARDRNTNAELGPVLKGVALTNSPNIPNLPRNTVIDGDILTLLLSDEGEVIAPVYDIEPGAVMTVNATPAAEAPAPAAPEVETPSPTAKADEAAAGFFKTLEAGLSTFFSKAKPEPVAEAPAPELAPTAPPAQEISEMTDAEKAEKAALEKVAADAQAEAVTAKAEAERLAAEKAQLETEKAALEAEKAAIAQAAADAQAQRQAADAAAKEQQLVLMLSDRCDQFVKDGVPPVTVDKAKALITAIRQSTPTLMLSDVSINTEDAVFEMLSDLTGIVEFKQSGTGETPTPSNSRPPNRLLAK